MPNHVTSVCTVTGTPAAVAAFVERHIARDPERPARPPAFLCDTVIPKPASVRATTSGSRAEVGLFALTGKVQSDWRSGSRMVDGVALVPCERWRYLPRTVRTREALLAHLKEHDPKALDEGAAAKVCLDETGHPDWYEWSIANWGTKWGAYDFEERERGDGRYVFKFETAWSFPTPVFEKLAKDHPGLVFDLVTFDEGYCFGGEGQFNGRGDFHVSKDLATDEMYERVYGEPPEKDED